MTTTITETGEIAKTYSGFISSFEKERSSKLLHAIGAGYKFSDSFSLDDWELQRKEIFFLVLSEGKTSLDGIALVERMHGTGGTRKPKYSFTDAIRFSPPIAIKTITAHLPEIAVKISSPANGIRLEASEWEKLVDLVKQTHPRLAEKINQLLRLVDRDAQLLGETNKTERLAEQRDAVGMCLDIAGSHRAETLRTITDFDSESADSILDLMDGLSIQERSLVEAVRCPP